MAGIPSTIMSVDPNDYMFGSSASDFGIQSASLQNPSQALAASTLTGLGQTQAPGLAGPGGFSIAGAPTPGTGLGFNAGTAGLALQGLQTIGNLWGAFQAAKLAKKQFNFTKEFANTNLANQIQTYNTTLADRGRSRAFVEGQSQDQAQSWLDENKLQYKQVG